MGHIESSDPQFKAAMIELFKNDYAKDMKVYNEQYTLYKNEIGERN